MEEVFVFTKRCLHAVEAAAPISAITSVTQCSTLPWDGGSAEKSQKWCGALMVLVSVPISLPSQRQPR
jgi:hypothetical protein